MRRPSRPAQCPRPAAPRGGGLDANVGSRRRRLSRPTNSACGAAAGPVGPRVGELGETGETGEAKQCRAKPCHRRGRRRRRVIVHHEKIAGVLAGGSRQAQRPADRPAAGIDAASMAASMPLTTLKTAGPICPNHQAATSEGGWGTLPGEVKEGGPAGPGGTRAKQSPPSSLRPSRRATNTNDHDPRRDQACTQPPRTTAKP